MRAVVVDDEPLAREGVELALQAENVTVVAQCRNGYEAVSAIVDNRPDIVFLDINMPGMSGFDVIDKVGIEDMPVTVFLTAYDQYAVEAFRVNAVDYLLKPIDEKCFRQALERCRSMIRQRQLCVQQQHLTRLMQALALQDVDAATLDSPLPERIMIRNAGHVYFIRPRDIHWVEAEGDYVSLHTAGRSHLVRETMKNMELKLQPLGFQRIHRSSLVKLDLIRELVANDSGDYQVILHDDTVLRLSRNYRDALYATMQLRSGPSA